MRNYLVFMNKQIPFQYPEDRELEVGTSFVIEFENKDKSTSSVKVSITKIEKTERAVNYYCERI